MKISVLAVSLVAGLAAAANADDLARWTFETSIPASAGPFVAEAGTFSALSVASGFHASGAAVYSSPAGNGSLHSFSSNNWGVGDYYQFTTVTTGYAGVSFTWDQTGSNTGPRDFAVVYSTDGGSTFSNLVTAYVVTLVTPWSSGTNQPSYTMTASAAGLDNVASLIIRIKATSTASINGGTVGTGGTGRVDNVIVAGTAVPTPGSLGLMGLAGLVSLRRRR